MKARRPSATSRPSTPAPERAHERAHEQAHALAWLEIDLDAIASNYRLLAGMAAGNGAVCAAVVKADGYGLGATRIGRRLATAGCRTFFVAHLDEAIALRPAVPTDAEVFVLNGLVPQWADDYIAADVAPVLNSLAEIDAWAEAARQHDRRLPACIHIDTGMNRLGLPAREIDALAQTPGRLDAIAVRSVISHLACADTPADCHNDAQMAAFRVATARIGDYPRCLANSSGVFLGPDYHFEMVRPGVALYGINPTPMAPNPMRAVVSLKARILQVRSIDTPQTVGYGASRPVPRGARIATVAVGYADGYLRSLSNRGFAMIADRIVPLVGRVSMDLITFDVTDVPEPLARPGATVELIGRHVTADSLADKAGTIGYEILTSLGRRYGRHYLDTAETMEKRAAR